MPPLFPPEFRLAAAFAMWPPSDLRTEAIHAAASEALDWPRFLRVATRHQVIGLIHEGLTRARPNVPMQIADEIGTKAAALVRENLAMAHEAMRIQRLFDDADLPVLFVKGPALAVLAFGNLGLRNGQDIDLLVPHEALSAATTVLLRAGYRRFDPPPNVSDAQLQLVMPLRKDLGLVHQITGLRIELHWRLFLNPHVMAESSFLATSRVVHLSGAAGLRTLGEDDLFAYLCMHGALHWWNRLKWLADVNALLASMPQSGVERLVEAAERKGVGRAAAQALLLCHKLFQKSLPASLAATLDKSITIRWLEASALRAMTTGQGEYDPHEVRLGTTRGSLSTFLLNRSWRYQLAELGIHLTNPTDVLTIRLPQPLQFLYPVLRLPLWAWRHSIHRGRSMRPLSFRDFFYKMFARFIFFVERKSRKEASSFLGAAALRARANHQQTVLPDGARVKLRNDYTLTQPKKSVRGVQRCIVHADVNQILSGLGCQMMLLAVCWVYAKHTNRTLLIDWRGNMFFQRDPSCNLFPLLFQHKDYLAGVPCISDQFGETLRVPQPLLGPAGGFVQESGISHQLPVGGVQVHVMKRIISGGIDVSQRTLLPSLVALWAAKKDVYALNQAEIRSFFQALRLQPEIWSRIKQFRDHHFTTSPIIGVHVRHGNGEQLMRDHFKRRVIVNFEGFVEDVEARILTYVRDRYVGAWTLFLATDSNIVIEAFSKRFKNIVYQKCWHPQPGTGIAPDSSYQHPDGPLGPAIEALVDFYLLSYCDVAITTRPTSLDTALPSLMHKVESEVYVSNEPYP